MENRPLNYNCNNLLQFICTKFKINYEISKTCAKITVI